MRTRVIVNPTAGDESGPTLLPSLNDRLRHIFEHVDIVLTTGEGDAERAAARAAEEGCDLIVAGGGDGTLNEVLNGVASVEGALARVTLGVLPLGTGNDFARSLGLPDDPEAAVEMLAEGRPVQVDIGVLNRRLFVNASAGGFVAETSARVTPRLKTLAGSFAYVIGGAQALLEAEPVPTRVRLDSGEQLELGLQMFAVANAPTIGGGYRLAPDARFDDGLLDLCLVGALTTAEFVLVLMKMLRGQPVDDDRVLYRRGKTFEFRFGRRTKVNTDGEVLEATECRYEVVPRAARVMAPNRDADHARRP